ncbi:hypothetical protein GCM10023155_47080 [Bremerella cremea]
MCLTERIDVGAGWGAGTFTATGLAGLEAADSGGLTENPQPKIAITPNITMATDRHNRRMVTVRQNGFISLASLDWRSF